MQVLNTLPEGAPLAHHFVFRRSGHGKDDEVKLKIRMRVHCFEMSQICVGGIVGPASCSSHLGADLGARQNDLLDFFNPLAPQETQKRASQTFEKRGLRRATMDFQGVKVKQESSSASSTPKLSFFASRGRAES